MRAKVTITDVMGRSQTCRPSRFLQDTHSTRDTPQTSTHRPRGGLNATTARASPIPRGWAPAPLPPPLAATAASQVPPPNSTIGPSSIPAAQPPPSHCGARLAPPTQCAAGRECAAPQARHAPNLRQPSLVGRIAARSQHARAALPRGATGPRTDPLKGVADAPCGSGQASARRANSPRRSVAQTCAGSLQPARSLPPGSPFCTVHAGPACTVRNRHASALGSLCHGFVSVYAPLRRCNRVASVLHSSNTAGHGAGRKVEQPWPSSKAF